MVFLENLKLAQLNKKSPALMESEDALLCSKKHTIGPYLNPAECSSQLPTFYSPFKRLISVNKAVKQCNP
jgi:hypothetical protein